MKISRRLAALTRIFLDTAPVIYYIEGHPRYVERASVFFDGLDAGHWQAVVSPITLAECLVVPYRQAHTGLEQAFQDLMLTNPAVQFVGLDAAAAQAAARLRARYSLTLTDAFQMAIALTTQCNGFLTNDTQLKRVIELNVIVLDEVEPD